MNIVEIWCLAKNVSPRELSSSQKTRESVIRDGRGFIDRAIHLFLRVAFLICLLLISFYMADEETNLREIVRNE